jgi:hypothetical protein
MQGRYLLFSTHRSTLLLFSSQYLFQTPCIQICTLCLSYCPSFCAVKIALLMLVPPPIAAICRLIHVHASKVCTQIHTRDRTHVVVRPRPIVDRTPMHARLASAWHASARHAQAHRSFKYRDFARVPRVRGIARAVHRARAWPSDGGVTHTSARRNHESCSSPELQRQVSTPPFPIPTPNPNPTRVPPRRPREVPAAHR